MNKQLELIDVEHPDRGAFHDRVRYNEIEAAFSDAWEKQNIPCSGINFGSGILQDLFCERDKCWVKRIHEVTPSERFVSATVVQWLGTNCGMSFLTEALRKCGYRISRIK